MSATTPEATQAAAEGQDETTEDEPALTNEQATTQALVAKGIEYTEKFTLKAAVQSWNATRKDILSTTGVVLLAASAQQLPLDDEAWFVKYAGDIVLRRPSFLDEMDMRVRYCDISRNLPVDAATAQMIRGACVAEFLCDKRPDWCDPTKPTTNDMQTAFLLVDHWYTEWSARFR